VLSSVERQFAKVQTVVEAKVIRDKAEAIRVYAKRAKLANIQKPGGDGEDPRPRAGKLIAALDRAQGKDQRRLGRSGVVFETARRWQAMSTIDEAEVRRPETECTERAQKLTSAGIFRLARDRPHRHRPRPS
jgi:hypothetical protein